MRSFRVPLPLTLLPLMTEDILWLNSVSKYVQCTVSYVVYFQEFAQNSRSNCGLRKKQWYQWFGLDSDLSNFVWSADVIGRVDALHTS